MKSTFTSTLTAILNDEDEIEGLPNNKLIACTDEGLSIQGNIPRLFFRKIARLQTLIKKTLQHSETLDYNGQKELAESIGMSVLESMAQASKILRDEMVRISMLERIIVELIRDEFPSESNVFDFRYRAHIGQKIIKISDHQRLGSD